MPTPRSLERLTAGQLIVFGGDQVVEVDEALAAAFAPGDRLVVVQESGDLLHVPAAEHVLATEAVGAATHAFAELATCTDDQITAFYEQFAQRLADDVTASPILAANADDVTRAERAGRSTTRLVLTEDMRREMVRGLRSWRDAALRRDAPITTVEHDGWTVEARRAPLGVVGFVFEGRPNVFADATGVLRTGNTVVMRIGSDALATADAIVTAALDPALAAAGLPTGTVALVRSPSRAAGWALFDDQRLSLAVARGSGAAVAQLGAVARQAGTPVSLHGTGGAWLVAGRHADADRFRAAVLHSLDRKVCNTLNVCCIPASRPELVSVFLDALDAAASRRDAGARLHVESSSRDAVPAERFDDTVTVRRADGDHVEPAASLLDACDLGREWEWEGSPEVTLVVTTDVHAAVELCNRHSPRFVASVISEDDTERDRFYAAVDAPFVGDGFTRWVDGQYALDTPELGLANWQGGRLLARGGVLSGDSVHTVRHRARITDPGLHR
ncbi:MAG: aldehyde dehydrogenase family protein [Ilumatobacteraceae bacterium]